MTYHCPKCELNFITDTHDCPYDKPCKCAWRDRVEGEEMRDWVKDCMCMFHWMQTDYYVTNAHLRKNILTGELLDLITLMPDSQTQEIIDYIMDLRRIRAGYVDTKTDI